MKKTNKKDLIVKTYTQLVKQNGSVKMKDLREKGISKDSVAHYFGSLSELDAEVRKSNPKAFGDVSIESLYSDQALDDLRKNIAGCKRFVITTAVNGKEIDHDFYASIKNYCTENEAKLLILVSSDPASNLASHGKSWGTISSDLKGETIVLEDTKLNNNLFISTIKLSAKQVDPTTGMARIGQKYGTCIYASPKQRLKAIPVPNNKLPHFMMTTGAITKPDYNTDLYMSLRTAYLADNDHVMGALIVEIRDEEIFHFRQIQADKNGCFVDLGVQYCPKFIKKTTPEAFVLGDWHSGSTDINAALAWFDVMDELQPKKVILHDAFDALSINHHEEGKLLLKAKRAEQGQLNLFAELNGLALDIKGILQDRDFIEELVIVKSNHDLFLERYLQEGKYINDPENHRLALDLAIHMLEGRDPLEEAVHYFFTTEEDEKLFQKIKWLKLDGDYKVEGIQCGAHGHLGQNGSKATIDSVESMYGNSVTGHTHTAQILRGAWIVGTSSKLCLEYNKGGASSWSHTSCLIYKDGLRQLINSIDGEWKL